MSVVALLWDAAGCMLAVIVFFLMLHKLVVRLQERSKRRPR